MTPPRILLLEDEPAIADTLVYALRSDGFGVVHVRLASQALRELRETPPALALLDISVSDGNGFDVCREVRRTSAVPIVFLTARSEEIDRILGLELGADDYVSKPFSPREVCARVRAILRRSGQAVASGAVAVGPTPSQYAPATGPADEPASAPTRAPTLVLDEPAQRIRCHGNPLTLTRYEYGLLATLLRRPQRIFSRAELMALVWSDAPDSSDRTIDAHVKLLRAKLRECGLQGELIQTHRHMGYSIRLPD
jgi:two-component system catabolic regulation response regulator CreB